MSGTARAAAKKPAFVDPATFHPYFSWRPGSNGAGRGELVACESVTLQEVAEKVGTPAYVYSRAAITEAYRGLDEGLGALPHTVCYAVKANGNLTILKHLASMGSGFDIVSGGELAHLRRIGVRGDRIVFSGVGKTREEMREALEYPAQGGARGGIRLFNVESPAELEAMLAEASRRKNAAGPPAVSIRVNPDVRAGGHPHIATGCHEHKFGLDWGAARRLYREHAKSKWIAWSGISAHIGSQIVELEPFRRALRRLRGYVQELRAEEIELKYLDLGGGLGVRYTQEQPPSRVEYARMVAEEVRPLGLHLLLEPGRTIIGAAGVLLTRVLYVKENRGKRFVVVDAGMNDLMRPALYGAIHPITAVTRASDANGAKRKRAKQNGAGRRRADIVGPVCETGDCFLHDWPLGEVEAGELLAIWATGAYGMSLATNYNARCRAVEVLVEGERYRVIRRRETPNDLVANDILA